MTLPCMALLNSTSLHFTQLYSLLYSTMRLLHSTSLNVALVFSTMRLLHSTSLNVALLYSTMRLLHSTSLNVALVFSTMCLLHSTSLNVALVFSTLLHYASSSLCFTLYITLQCLYFVLDSTSFYHCSTGCNGYGFWQELDCASRSDSLHVPKCSYNHTHTLADWLDLIPYIYIVSPLPYCS